MAVAALVLVIACGAIAAGWGYVRAARRARAFVATDGTVVGRDVVAVAPGREGRWGRGGGYRPKVTYRYAVDGVTHTSDRWSYATEGFKRSVAEQRLAAIEDDVVVHYDPDHPADAYLRLPTPGFGYALVVAGIIGVLVAAMLAVS